MKMKYVRQEKKKNKNDVLVNPTVNPNGTKSENSAIAPEIEEYFCSTPKPSYPTNSYSSSGASKGVKIAKDAITYCIWTSR